MPLALSQAELPSAQPRDARFRGNAYTPCVGPPESASKNPWTEKLKHSYNGLHVPKTFEEQSRTTAGDGDSFSSDLQSFERNYPDAVDANSILMQGQYENVAARRGENMMRRSGAMRDAGRSNNHSGGHHELYNWAAKYAEGEDEDSEELGGALQAYPTQASHRHHQDLMYVFDKYICKKTEGAGVTIMLHDVPYRFQVDPDVFTMIKTIGNMDTVDYVYLPMAVDRPSAIQCRNKGYCFIHFRDPVAARDFSNDVYYYQVPDVHSSYDEERSRQPGKGIFAVMAKFQGLSLNLNNLLDIHSKKWRPKNGVAYVRTDTGLVPVRLLALRNLAKQYAQLCSNSGSSFGLPLYASVVE